MTTTTPAARLPVTVDVVFTPRPHIRRVIVVKVPDENQLAVWAASGQRFSSLGDEWSNGEAALTASNADPDGPEWAEFRRQRSQQATNALSRAMRILRAAMVNPADADWLEDMLLDGVFQLGDAMGVLTGAVEQLRDLKPDAAPTTGPAKKARRS